MKAYLATRLSEHLAETPEGYLIARNAILCRTAVRNPQEYRGSEIGLAADDLVDVFRPEDEVYAASFLASLEGKALTEGHPSRFLDTGNTSWHQRGHISNVRIGPRLPNGEGSIIGDIIVTDPATIEKIKNGQLRELSVGYSCDYLPRSDGSYEQHHLVANHVALTPSGRAGEDVRILDSKGSRMNAIDELIDRVKQLTQRINRERAEDAEKRRRVYVADDDPDLIPVPSADRAVAVVDSEQSRSADFVHMCKQFGRKNPAEVEVEHLPGMGPARERPCRTYDWQNDEDYGKMARQYFRKPVKVHKD